MAGISMFGWREGRQNQRGPRSGEEQAICRRREPSSYDDHVIEAFPMDRAILWRSPLCGAKPGAPRQTLVSLRVSTT